MTTKYTPGPWAGDTVSEYTGEILVRAQNGDTVARVCCYGPQSDTPRAQAWNARLIAAAPELADALAWALDQIEDDLCPDHQAALEHARAVLARAQGAGL
jgi:hypothetical protein